MIAAADVMTWQSVPWSLTLAWRRRRSSTNTSVLGFRRRRPGGGFDRAKAELPARSIYHLSGEARHQWEHSIAEMALTRWSITFRSLTASFTRQPAAAASTG
jgi:hypothetical protein